MTINPNSKSYPFLALAQRTGSNYGDVLSYADLVKNPSEFTRWHRLARDRLSHEVQNEIISIITDMPGFTYWFCDDCGFDAVTNDKIMTKTPICPLCAGDNGRDVYMVGRVARTTDTGIEGKDARVP